MSSPLLVTAAVFCPPRSISGALIAGLGYLVLIPVTSSAQSRRLRQDSTRCSRRRVGVIGQEGHRGPSWRRGGVAAVTGRPAVRVSEDEDEDGDAVRRRCRFDTA